MESLAVRLVQKVIEQCRVRFGDRALEKKIELRKKTILAHQ